MPIDGNVSDRLPRDITVCRDSGGFFHTGAVGGGTLQGGAQSDAEEDGAVQQDAEVVEAPFEDCSGSEEGERVRVWGLLGDAEGGVPGDKLGVENDHVGEFDEGGDGDAVLDVGCDFAEMGVFDVELVEHG